ncbi:hypothetical protein ELY21_14930 [Legionella sp. km535]|uniref:hypothetical protein n=1 Tax=Legionella sp. km535 TaxID=2498107 RepID=UPI000F8F200E|nr:hypothetical protein [Legionella sp. km535]RUR15180.1 hypothetical protein ELY21_14930 [Legionella sp. km535]
MKTPPEGRQEKIELIQELFKKLPFDQLMKMHGNNWKLLKTDEFSNKLKTQTDYELDCILARTDEYRPYYKEKAEKERFFNHPDCDADFAYWSKQIVWSIDEGIALILGKEPRKVYWENIKEFTDRSPLAKKFEEIRTTAKGYVKFQQLSDPVVPSVFLTWVQRMNFTDVNVPCALIESIESLGIQLTDWQELYKKMESSRDKLKEQYSEAVALIESQSKFIQSLKHEIDELSISPNSEKTLLKIIGSLVETMFMNSTGGKQISPFNSQAALIEFLEDNFPKVKGISKSTLEDKFAKGKKLLEKNK